LGGVPLFNFNTTRITEISTMATKTASAPKTKTRVRPLEDRVMIRPQQAETRTTSGIYLPDTAKEKPMQGKVLAVGPGKINDDDVRTPLQVKAGDVVVYGKYSGTEVEVDGEKLVLLRESELLAKLED
jgi:chaperonin GroES